MKELLCLLATAVLASGAQYYVRTDGSDANAGTANSAGGAWATVQKAATTLTAGDTVTVVAGTYPEYVDLGVAGTSSAPITFNTSGTVRIRGFNVDHPYIIIDGFLVTDYSPTSLRGAITVTSDGDGSIVRNCSFDLDSWVSGASIVFNPAGPTITASGGGFSAAGFRAGMTVFVARNTGVSTPGNNGKSFTVSSVTDTALTLSGAGTMVSETASCILVGTNCYGIQLNEGSDGCSVYGNIFTGQGAAWILMGGSNHTITRNTFTHGDGWDAIIYSGTDHIVSWNKITDGVSVAYNASPDVFEHWSASTTARVIFANNYVDNWDGVIGLHKNSTIGNNGEVHFLSNVFANTGRLMIRMPNCHVKGNTFYKVAYTSTAVRSPMDHPVAFDNQAGTLIGCKVEDNLFLACGDGAGSTKGWYSAHSGQTLTADYNWAAGDASGFGSKTGFSETHGTNGGNPGVASLANLIGADLTAMTADDGLAPAAGSGLLSTAHNGMDRGAYQVGNVFWVSPRGSNAAAGTAAAPWLTLAYAESQMAAGKTLLVDWGDYNERTSIDGNGTAVDRIVFYSPGGELPTKGGASTRGFSITGDYVTLDGLEINGALTNDAVLGTLCDYGVLKNLYIHDTTGASFLRAIQLKRGSDPTPSAGPLGWIISDNLIDNAVQSAFVVSGKGHLIERNEVRNLREDLFLPFGEDHIFRRNVLRSMSPQTSGHPDVVQSWGQPGVQDQWSKNVLIEENFFINQFYYSTATSVSFADNGANPDTITRSSGSWITDGFQAGHNVTIWNAASSTNNLRDFGRDIDSVTATTLTLAPNETLATSANDTGAIIMASSLIQPMQLDDPGPNTSGMIFRRNVFYNIDGGGTANFADMIFEGNVYYNCDWVTVNVITISQGGGATFRNNIFLGCGRNQNRNGIDAARGWYGWGPSHNGTISANHNYVASSNYAPKNSTFTETNGVNGGDPLFLSESSPLGADGLPWTADDGFAPMAGSPLLGAGQGGSDIGPYGVAVPAASAAVQATNTTATTITVQ